jgi:hypothetical protein
MPKYRIRCTAKADVEMTLEIFAESEDEARELALDESFDGVWEYEQLCDDAEFQTWECKEI